MFMNAENISLIIFDFDGVLTDNRVIVSQDGSESVVCNRADGLGFDMLRAAGLPCFILSTETNPVVSRRAQKLKVDVLQGATDKGLVVRNIIKSRQLDPEKVVYVGNDLNDMPAFNEVGWRICPSDAVDEVKLICRLVLSSPGGGGVVREIARLLGLTLK
jgi:3-deoxy-D-manno-octulosonate 8-phosphate phosphatase (KDO 8-P phosphatase)